MPSGGVSAPPRLPAALYRGSANAWECDDGGHLNVRFQCERAMMGLAHLAAALKMPQAFAAGAGATLIPIELHVRFLKEARPGATLDMHGGVIEIGEQEAVLCLDMRHGDGAPASAFRLRVAHADPRTMKVFPWSARTRAAAAALACALPEHARPRSLDLARPPREANVSRAVALGAARTGAYMATPDQCDAFGRMRAEFVFGRMSDSAPNLLAEWRRAIADAAAANGGAAVSPAGAVVEARVAFLRWPHAGDLIEVRSGVVAVAEKVNRLGHWLLDPASGAAWATAEVVALSFDTLTRKALTPSPQARAAMAAGAIPEMGF